MATSVKICLYCILLLLQYANRVLSLNGTWEILLRDAGVSSMHTAVTRFGTVVLLGRKVTQHGSRCLYGYGVSTSGHCVVQSAEYYTETNTLRHPLAGVLSDTWCSSGQFSPNGTLVQTGGYGSGIRTIRYFIPCPQGQRCRWVEARESSLKAPRWYATNQILADGRQIVAGGIGVSNFEYVPPQRRDSQPTNLALLRNEHANYKRYQSCYPFLHLLPNGNLFVMAGTDSVLLDPHSNTALRSFPSIPDGVPRTYPAGGSSAMLPLEATDGYRTATVVVCGGSHRGAYWQKGGNKLSAVASCGRIRVMDRDPAWKMEDMPFRRTMGDMVMLPNGEILIINGALKGSQGYNKATDPALIPVIYKPSATHGSRFEVQSSGTVPRMYHSTANLMPDGRVLVAGSNAHQSYVFEGDFPSELRLEAFSPGYLNPVYDKFRASINGLDQTVRYGGEFSVEVEARELNRLDRVEVNLVSAPFATHSFSQGQRLVRVKVVSGERQSYNTSVEGMVIRCEAPPRSAVAPPGYYMVFVVNNRIPTASARWIQLVR